MPASRTVARKPTSSDPGAPRAGAARLSTAKTPNSATNGLTSPIPVQPLTRALAPVSGFGKLMGAKVFRGNQSEIRCHLHVHSGIVGFYIVDQFQPGLAVVQARAHRSAGLHRRSLAGEAETGLV